MLGIQSAAYSDIISFGFCVKHWSLSCELWLVFVEVVLRIAHIESLLRTVRLVYCVLKTWSGLLVGFIQFESRNKFFHYPLKVRCILEEALGVDSISAFVGYNWQAFRGVCNYVACWWGELVDYDSSGCFIRSASQFENSWPWLFNIAFNSIFRIFLI